MKSYYGNYLGLCINNVDPENRGRVQIFIPHIMPALYDGWNNLGEDISFECIGNNLPNGLPSPIVDKLIKILPWAEAATPIIGNSVAGTYNPETGNFNQTSTPEGVALSLNQTTFDTGLGIGVDSNGRVDKKQFQGYLQQAISKSTLNNWKPADGARYGIDGSASSWTNFFYHLANRESSLKVNTVGDVGKFVGNSNGLFQLSPLDYSNYAAQMKAAGIQPGATVNGKPAFSQQQLTDPITNTNAAVVIAQTLIKKSNAIGDNRSTGAARYWGPLSKGWTPPPAGKINIANPASAPDASALGASDGPFKKPEPYQTQREPTQDAITQINTPTSVTVGPGFGTSIWNQVNSKYPSKTNNCGVRARDFDYAVTKDSYFLQGLSVTGDNPSGFASRSVNYWLKSGYYELAQQPPQQLAFGTKIIFQNNKSGTNAGHVTTVADGRLVGSGGNESWGSYAKLNNNEATFLVPSKKYRDLFQGKYNSGLPTYNFTDVTKGGTAIADDGGYDVSSNIVKNTTDTTAVPLDTTGMAQGMFGIPGPGAMLWVFFREGNPMFPVYFAASYGAAEWQSAYRAASPVPYGPQGNSSSSIESQTVIRPNNAGAITFTGAVSQEGDKRTVRVAHANGGYLEFHSYGSINYSPNEHMTHTAGTQYNYCLNREEWTQGNDNRVTIGNQWVVVGNPSQANIETIEKLTEKVKQINAEMTKA